MRTATLAQLAIGSILLSAWSACGFDPHPRNGVVPCSEGCPSGYFCGKDNTCWAPATGGRTGTGGAGTGGAHATGGDGSGGSMPGQGGNDATGGTNNSGGTSNMGGTIATGGTARAGGASGTGGIVSFGGTTSLGGSGSGGLIATGGRIGSGGTTGFGGWSGTGGMGGQIIDAAVDRSIIGTGGQGVDGATDRRYDATDAQTVDTQLDSAAPAVALSIVPTPLDFGSVMLFGSSSLTIMVTNLRTASTAITFGGISGSADFSLAGGSCPNGYPQLSVGAACTILVRFAPTSTGPKTAELSLTAYWSVGTSGEYDSVRFSVPLSGTASAEEAIDAAGSAEAGRTIDAASTDTQAELGAGLAAHLHALDAAALNNVRSGEIPWTPKVAV